MRRFLNALYFGAAVLGALCIFLLFVLMILGSVGRELNLQVSGVNDIVAWLCAAGVFLTMAQAFRNGDFVRVSLLLEIVPAGLRRGLDFLCLLIALAAVAYLTYWATLFTWESYEYVEYSMGLIAIPIWIPQSSFVIGCWVFLIAVIDETVCVARGAVPSYQRAVDERHAKGDFSSEV